MKQTYGAQIPAYLQGNREACKTKILISVCGAGRYIGFLPYDTLFVVAPIAENERKVINSVSYYDGFYHTGIQKSGKKMVLSMLFLSLDSTDKQILIFEKTICRNAFTAIAGYAMIQKTDLSCPDSYRQDETAR